MITETFKNKYRTTTTRLKHWDYSQCGWNFITICTKNSEHFFGNIINSKMELSEIGKIVKQEWIKTPKIRPDMNLTLEEFIVMPNHFHAIIIIDINKYNVPVNAQCFAHKPNEPGINKETKPVETQCLVSNSNTSIPKKEAQSIARLQEEYTNKFGP